MKQKLIEFIKNKKKQLLLLLVAVASLSLLFVSLAIDRITTEPMHNGGSVHTFPASSDVSLDVHGIVRGADGMGSGIPTHNNSPMLLAGNSQARQASGGAAFGIASHESLIPTQLADNLDDSGDVEQESLGMNPEAYSNPNEGSIPTVLENPYLVYDRDFLATPNLQANSHGSSSTQSPERPKTSPVNNDKPLSHAPEPATMLLFGSGLIGLAAFGRKLRKR